MPPIHGGAIQMTHEKIKGLELITLELKAWTQITANKKIFPPTFKKNPFCKYLERGKGWIWGLGMSV